LYLKSALPGQWLTASDSLLQTVGLQFGLRMLAGPGTNGKQGLRRHPRRPVIHGCELPETLMFLDVMDFMAVLKGGIDHCPSETSVTYEGDGRWTVSITFLATEPETARFSFREDTGEVIALNLTARNLVGY